MSIFSKQNSQQTAELPDRVIIYKSELEYVSRCILDYPNIETGGNLFGYYTTFHIPVIQYVLGPGKNAEHHSVHFRQDVDFFNRNADMLINEHALNHIGTWHSHHQMNLDHPSGGDVSSMFNGMKEDGIDAFLLVIGNVNKNGTSAKAYSFSMQNKDYHYIPWVVLDEDSPIRLQFDKKHSNGIYIPHTDKAVMCQTDNIPLFGEKPKQISYPKGHWLNDKENNKELKIILDYLKKNNYKFSLFLLEEDQTLEIIIKEPCSHEIVFPLGFPKKAPKILRKGNMLQELEWKKNGSISQRVINYFETSLNNYEKEALQ